LRNLWRFRPCSIRLPSGPLHAHRCPTPLRPTM